MRHDGRETNMIYRGDNKRYREDNKQYKEDMLRYREDNRKDRNEEGKVKDRHGEVRIIRMRTFENSNRKNYNYQYPRITREALPPNPR